MIKIYETTPPLVSNFLYIPLKDDGDDDAKASKNCPLKCVFLVQALLIQINKNQKKKKHSHILKIYIKK